MPPTRVYLLRHAETTWNAEGRLQGHLDAPLSERGRRQLEALTRALRPVALAALYSSPLSRARVCAEAVGAACGLAVQPVDEFREMNQGEWEGRLVDEVVAADGARVQAWWDAPHEVQVPGGESLQQLQARALRGFERVVARHHAEAVAIMAHGGVNKVILLAVLGAPLSHHGRIRQANACINIIEVNGESRRVVLLNDTVHLGT
jgi:alpha-ribazole phosphatase/probable phosphoglycerate mutase